MFELPVRPEPPTPTPAERVRTLLAAAESLTVRTEGHRCELTGLHTVDALGRVMLWAPAHSCLSRPRHQEDRGNDGAPATVEITDVAPLAVRDRVRARLRAHGWLEVNGVDAAYGSTELCLDIGSAVLTVGPASTTVDAGDLVAAEVDPLAAAEAEMLIHLAGTHPRAVSTLTRLVDPRRRHAVVRVDPLSLDRYGLVLRLQRHTGHDDIRLPFRERALDVAHAQRQLRLLLAAAERAPGRCRQGTA